MNRTEYAPSLAPIPACIEEGVSTTTQDPGMAAVSRRPDHLGGGVYIMTRKEALGGLPGRHCRQYVALDRPAASRLLADLAMALAVPCEA